jgi:uncharacterized YccA/Bax inhibitor family protein
MFNSSNPALSEKAFSSVQTVSDNGVMTVQGTVDKTFWLFAMFLVTASYVWTLYFSPETFTSVPDIFKNTTVLLVASFITSIIAALLTIFKKDWSAKTAPIYALCEGILVGSISAFAAQKYGNGMVFQAVFLTLAIFGSLLFAYKTRLIQVSDKLRSGIVIATMGIAIVYGINLLMGFFGHPISFINGSSTLGIIFTGVVVVIAAMNLLLDFDFIEKAAVQNLPKYMEWYAAFGLMVTLVWLYLEILRLLRKLADRK